MERQDWDFLLTAVDELELTTQFSGVGIRAGLARTGLPGMEKKPKRTSRQRVMASIQATDAALDWERQPGSVFLTVETCLPDEYVIPVVEALQEQKGDNLKIFIRMEIRGLEPSREGNTSNG